MSSFCRTRASIRSPTLTDLVRVDVVADRELLGRDHALGLVADVEEDLVAVDLHDDALHDVAVLEVAERGLHGLHQFFRACSPRPPVRAWRRRGSSRRRGCCRAGLRGYGLGRVRLLGRSSRCPARCLGPSSTVSAVSGLPRSWSRCHSCGGSPSGTRGSPHRGLGFATRRASDPRAAGRVGDQRKRRQSARTARSRSQPHREPGRPRMAREGGRRDVAMSADRHVRLSGPRERPPTSSHRDRRRP